MSQPVTNQQLRQLLSDLGFEQQDSVEPKCLVFEHPESHARLLLPTNRDNQAAKSADILSLRTHLLYRGHLSEEAFDSFVEHGRLHAS
ncbi:hypothetical protein GC176_02165 [bacterium]|nr:hypothetical protein [bacterium]